VTRLVRSRPSPGDVVWDPDRGVVDSTVLDGTDAVINLAGASVAGGRWTARRKQYLIDSRIRPAGLLAQSMARVSRRPSAFVSVSASGFYG
ncbi:epimerase, partial [Klebsiella pneumoniae]|nr:epimerase [Klebsiella pneumoniae]